jgi:hypothetical protein
MAEEPSTILIPTEPTKAGEQTALWVPIAGVPPRQRAIDVIHERARFQFNQTQRATLLKEQLPVGDLGFLTSGVVYRSSSPGRTAIAAAVHWMRATG